jgi:hypothetical protein
MGLGERARSGAGARLGALRPIAGGGL